jgi:NitT/TauT family transport system substrate-binding protein
MGGSFSRFAASAGLTIAGIFGLLAAEGGVAIAQNAPATLKVGYFPTIAHVAPIYVTEGRGYFAAEKLTVQPVQFARANEALPALITGEVDALFGVSVGGTLYNAIAARPGTVKLVAALLTVVPDDLVGTYVRTDLFQSGAVKSPADLKGRTVTLPQRGGAPEYALHAALKTAGLSVKDVKLQTLPSYDEIEQAFKSGAIELGVLGEPFATRARDAKIAVPLAPYGKYVNGEQLTFIAYGKRLLSDKDVGQRFMRAVVKGIADYETARQKGPNRAEVIKFIQQGLSGTSADVIDRAPWYYLQKDSVVNKDAVANQAAYFADQGFINKLTPVEEVIDMTFVQALGKK